MDAKSATEALRIVAFKLLDEKTASLDALDTNIEVVMRRQYALKVVEAFTNEMLGEAKKAFVDLEQKKLAEAEKYKGLSPEAVQWWRGQEEFERMSRERDYD